MLNILKALGANLLALGPRRLAALGVAGTVVFLTVGVSSYVLTRPEREMLYSGLDPADTTAMGAALGEAGMDFDVSESGDALLVRRGQAAKARMLLAHKGLPQNSNAGYELFDKLGSMGLTSFMQQVTKVRALEGELARTIQLIDGVKAARVHVTLGTEGGFRSGREKAAASVVIRGGGDTPQATAKAIRHLVASAIPGLSAGQVTVMTTDGELLSQQEDGEGATPAKLIELEREVATGIERNVLRTLAPYLGLDNVRVSVTAKLNADRQQISETKFDPESRVERSVRSFKESGEAENANGAEGVSVDQNIPQAEPSPASADSSREKKDRKEELTNYEINSRSVSTSSEGYGIERLSVAVIVNRAQVAKLLGDAATPEAIATQAADIARLVKSAAGADEARGDLVEVSPVDFAASEILEPVAEGGLMDAIGQYLGSLLNAAVLVIVTLIVVLLGLRPALRQILPPRETSPASPLLADGGPPGGGLMALDTSPMGSMAPSDPLLENLAREVSNSPRDRLVKIVELDPDRAAEVLRQWLNEPAGRSA